MDLLYKRYASPFSYLDGLLELGMLEQGIIDLVNRRNEELMFELYLHSNPFVAPQQSFNDWKKKLNAREEKAKPLNEKELKTAYEQSQEILNKFM